MERLSLATALVNEGKLGKLMPRACDFCRKKKVRCELVGDNCAQCIRYNRQCHFTPIKLKREPRRPPGYKHVELLEKRLKRMEAMLQAQVPIQIVDGDVEMEHQIALENVVRKIESSQPRLDTSVSLSKSDMNVEREPRDLNSFYMISPPSGEPVFTYLQDTPASMEKELQYSGSYWQFNATSDIFTHRTFKNFPPKADARLLIQEMFNSHNIALPLFDQASFLNKFEAHYTEHEREDTGWWACLNVVFALAHRFRAMRTLNSQTEDFHAWGYLQNALMVLPELTMLNSELLAVQAILGIAIVLQGTPNPRPCSVLISTALKMCHIMKLHRQDQGCGLNATEIEQRKRVFWIAYVIDKDISLRTGDPPAQDDEDMDVHLPAETVELNPACFGGVNFNHRIGLAIIQGRIYKSLSSIKALRRSEKERSLVAKELDVMIDAWKRSMSIGYANDDSSIALGASSLPTMLHAVILKFTYFHALTTIHSSLHINSHLQRGFTQTIMPALLPALSLQNDAICLAEARESINLFLKIPQGDFAYVWALLNHVHLASTIILSHVLLNSAFYLTEDLQIAEHVLKLLETLDGKETYPDFENMENSLRDLWKQASDVVRSVEGDKKKDLDLGFQAGNGNSNVLGDIRSVEDFIDRIEHGAECWREENWL